MNFLGAKIKRERKAKQEDECHKMHSHEEATWRDYGGKSDDFQYEIQQCLYLICLKLISDEKLRHALFRGDEVLST